MHISQFGLGLGLKKSAVLSSRTSRFFAGQVPVTFQLHLADWQGFRCVLCQINRKQEQIKTYSGQANLKPTMYLFEPCESVTRT